MEGVVYMVGFIVNGRSIFMGWRSVDLPAQSIVKMEGKIIHAPSLKGCVRRILELFPGSVCEESVFFDLDDVRARLASDGMVAADDAVNLWNMLTDINNSMAPDGFSSGELFAPEFMGVYDSFFSRASAGSMVGCAEELITVEDYSILLDIVDRGAAMLMRIDGASI